MKKLLIHVGAGKTGSTAIQNTLDKNKELLSNNNIKYLGMMLENCTSSIASWQYPDGWVEFYNEGLEKKLSEINMLFEKEFLDSDEDSVFIWSNEAFFEHPLLFKEIIDNLKKLPVDFTVEIFGFLRSHEQWLFSAYVQWSIKHKTYPGKVKSFKEWYHPEKVNFSSKVKNWLSIRNSVALFKSYDLQIDVAQSFFDHIGLSEYIKQKPSNTRASSTALMMWALYNNTIDGPSHPNELQNLLSVNNVVNGTSHKISINELFLDASDLKLIEDDCENDRCLLNELLTDNHMEAIPNLNAKVPDISVNFEQLIGALIKIVNNQNARLNNLEDQVKLMIKNANQRTGRL